MIEDIRVPTMVLGKIILTRWYVRVGDSFNANSPLCELETDKATVDLPTLRAGVIEYAAAAGTELRAGDLICTLRIHDH